MGVARRQSAVVGQEGRQGAEAPHSEREQIASTPGAQPDAIMGGGSTGRCVAGVRRAGCHEANGKCEQHGSEHGDRAPPSL